MDYLNRLIAAVPGYIGWKKRIIRNTNFSGYDPKLYTFEYDFIKNFPKYASIFETPFSILAKSGMIWYSVHEINSTKPTVSKVK